MATSPRISVRLTETQIQRLEDLCLESGCEVSHLVRHAIDEFLKAKFGEPATGNDAKRLSPPEQIIPLTAQYRAWGRGDLRTELKTKFADLLALSFTCRDLYPRTTNVVEGYEALLKLHRHFGL